MENINDEEPVKRGRGRPRKTPEELKLNKKNYETAYRKARYNSDEEYRIHRTELVRKSKLKKKMKDLELN